MRALTIIENLGWGGRQRAAQDYSIGLADAGWDIAVLAFEASGPREQILARQGIAVFVGGPTEEAQAGALQAACEWNPDLIHLHSAGPPSPSEARTVEHLLECMPGRIPVIETTSFGKVDFSPQRYDLTDVHLLMTKWGYWKWRQWSRPLRPSPLGVIIPITANPSAFYPIPQDQRRAFRKQYHLPDDAFVFGRIGQPSVWKWSPIIFDAFERVAIQHPHVYLLLVGLPDELRPRLESLATAIRDRIVEIPFLHGDEALRLAYGSLDAFLHASQIGESFGLVLTEAMLCECPVITLSTPSRDNSQLEVVGHMRGGLVVNDKASMAAAMGRLVKESSLRQRLAENGAAYVRAHYSLEHVVPQLMRVGHLALSASTREELRKALDTDPALTTGVTDDEISHLLHQTVGRVPIRQRVLLHLVHVPLFFRVWRFLKGHLRSWQASRSESR